jgi:hypothetical protein
MSNSFIKNPDGSLTNASKGDSPKSPVIHSDAELQQQNQLANEQENTPSKTVAPSYRQDNTSAPIRPVN